MTPLAFEKWLRPQPEGLYCEPGNFFIDPSRPVERAIITHGHSDHARPGHANVLATPETIDIMKIRLKDSAGGSFQQLAYGQPLTIGDVSVTLVPAGHILGSAQVVIDYKSQRAVVSGDYKRQMDATCAPFELVTCDLFITEATFGLPVFTHGDDRVETGRLITSLKDFPERAHMVGVYGLGKCQRLISLIRAQGYDKPIFLHGALVGVTEYYLSKGFALGEVTPIGSDTSGHAGEIILCPPSALGDRWSRRFADPLPGFASGWMRIRGRARQRGVELPMVISDHVDWPDLLQTIKETQAGEIWVTHGREEAAVHAAQAMGLKARALKLVGLEEEGE
jgi:putative mRNA 3-end processing factor